MSTKIAVFQRCLRDVVVSSLVQRFVYFAVEATHKPLQIAESAALTMRHSQFDHLRKEDSTKSDPHASSSVARFVAYVQKISVKKRRRQASLKHSEDLLIAETRL